jgi:phosphoglycerate dehydrogenase-like enzyme
MNPGDLLVVNSGVQVDEQVLTGMRGGGVLTTTSGHDHIDKDAAASHEVLVARCPMARRDAVVDWTMGHALALLHRWPDQWAASDKGVWAREALPDLAPRSLSGARVAVVGCGVIGRAVIERLQARGARVVGVDPAGVPEGVDAAPLCDVLADVDVLTLHCSLTPSSEHLVDLDALQAMQSHAIVLNSARGRSLDVRAAAARVGEGQLGGLAVDVFPVEPWPHMAEGGRSPRVLYTPHAAGFTEELSARVRVELGKALDAWQSGQTPHHRVA